MSIYVARTHETRRDHIHRLVREPIEILEDGKPVKYLYRCVTCDQRLMRKSGVLLPQPLLKKA